MAIPREPKTDIGHRRDYTPTPPITHAYLLGMLHDATERKTTYRIATSNFRFANILKKGIENLKKGVWLYKEGKKRNLWIVEFSKNWLLNEKILTRKEKTDYIRGYFDSEGGTTRDPNARLYIYFAQKNKIDLMQLKKFIEELNIKCGKIHNPSEKVDSNYWRFYVSAKSYSDFATVINSIHPVKRSILRKKI